VIRLQAHLFENLDDPETLRRTLQTALELEHATIPPYLFAAYSLKETNVAIRRLIVDVTYEEMLHMNLVANLINAVGGHPRLNSPEFVPRYPTNLPGAVQGDLIVPLAPFGKELLRDVFMKIEEPENPSTFPVLEAAEGAEIQIRTIGQFYARIKEVIRAGGPGLFTGDPQLQVAIQVDDDESFSITDVESACRAIDLIVGQGEGTPTSPLDATEEPAHYYRFQGILHGRALRKDDTVPEGFSFSGDAIPFDPTGVSPAKQNIKVADIPIDSPARPVAEQFNRDYTAMLGHLHRAFNGEQSQLDRAIRIMRLELRRAARTLFQIPIAEGVNAGPSFEFAPLN
jgi:hypothetical protein